MSDLFHIHFRKIFYLKIKKGKGDTLEIFLKMKFTFKYKSCIKPSWLPDFYK